MADQTVTLGTTNPGKISEVAALLAPLGIDLEPLSLEVPETTDTFEGNAIEKAVAYARHSGKIAISEDSGLVIPVLNGLPGVWSARFADLDLNTRQIHDRGLPREMIDPLNNELVLELLKTHKPREAREAYFRVVFIVANPIGEVLFSTSADAHGWIATEARGSNGFGYDPIFIGKDTYERTYAELDTARKNLRSHRKTALNSLYDWFEDERRSL